MEGIAADLDRPAPARQIANDELTRLRNGGDVDPDRRPGKGELAETRLRGRASATLDGVIHPHLGGHPRVVGELVRGQYAREPVAGAMGRTDGTLAKAS